MAEKKHATNLHPYEKIIEYDFEDLMGDRFGRYAKYIIQERALPDVRDGLKPVQRRILYGMKMLKLTQDKPYMKSARVVGDVMGKYHPHGDSSIYEALVRMSQSWKMGLPLVDMQGNNGSMDGDPAAAYRYTESRLQKASEYLLADLDKNAVEFAPNYDDKDVEPTVLPAFFPNILVNGSTGIAAGYATNMPPHNLNEVIDATIAMIENPEISVDELMKFIKGPDFPTGGVLQQLDGVKEAFSTGKGKVVINAKWHEEKDKIVIDEIPYEVIKQDLVKKIGEVSDSNPGLAIKDIIDESDKSGLRIVIKLSSKANLETVRKFLFKNTPLSVAYNYNNVVIINKQPKQVGLVEILKAYLAHYQDVYLRKTKYELEKALNRLEIIDGLINAMSILDDVIKTIRHSDNRKAAIRNLVEDLSFKDIALSKDEEKSSKKIHFTKVQAEAIVDMRLYRLTSTDVSLLMEEKATLEKDIKRFRKLIKDENYLNQTIIHNLQKIKEEYPLKRRSELRYQDESFEVNVKDTIAEKTYQLFVSQDGYLKAVDPAMFKINDLATFGRKPGDLFITNFEVSNMDHLLLISSAGLFYSIPLFKVVNTKWRDLGQHVNEFASMSGDVETLLTAIVVPSFKNLQQQLLIATKKGMIKRVLLSDLETKSFNKSFRLIRLADDDDEVVSAELINDGTHSVVVVNESGFGVRYDLNDIPIQKTNSKGVKSTSVQENIVGAVPLAGDQYVFLITDKDRWKKMRQGEVPMFIRPKKGTKLYPDASKKNKELVKFVFGVNHESVLEALNEDNEVEEFDLNRAVKLTKLEDKTASMDFKKVQQAVVLHNYVTDNNQRLGSTSAYLKELVSEANDESKLNLAHQDPNQHLHLKDEAIKASIDRKYAENDLYAMFDDFDNKKVMKKVDEEVDDTLSLDLDDLVDD